jgi:Mlc titration factor MtfA (ptsG expression regulator)
MESAEQARAWRETMAAARERLAEELRRGWSVGPRPPLRPYALTNPAEFFAVATEVFFERPDDLAEWDAELYGVMSRWYRQDPRG